jgi:membrane protease YdiL (CAAX protease family)
MSDPTNAPDIVLMFLGVAVIPPLIEEFSMRGVLLSSMQKYGNRFSMIATAFVFGLFHGNFTQIPFAFICGLFFAYTVIATDSIWPAVIMHGMNNALSCISSILLQVTDEKVSNIFFYACCMGGIALAGVALIVYLRKFKEEKILSFQGEASQLTLGQKMGKFIGSPVMIVAIIIYGIEALLTLTTQTPAP